MGRLEIAGFSTTCQVRRLGQADRQAVLELYRTNPLFFQMGNTQASMAYVERDMAVLPPGVGPERKYFVGFYEGEALAAVLDLVDGFPMYDVAYIGLYMVRGDLSGQGRGSRIIAELAGALRESGFQSLRLAYSVDNPQASHFWQKNGFQTLYDTDHPDYGHLNVAEYRL